MQRDDDFQDYESEDDDNWEGKDFFEGMEEAEDELAEKSDKKPQKATRLKNQKDKGVPEEFEDELENDLEDEFEDEFVE